MEKAACPYCGTAVALDSIESHMTSHETVQSDEEYVKQLLAQEEQALNESVALGLVQNDVANREKYESRSPLSSVITSTEHLTNALQQTDLKGQNTGPTARELDAQFLAYVDRTHRKGNEQEVAEISHVVLFDIDNCGNEFEQIADAFEQIPKLLVYVVGGPGLPNVPNVKLPIFAEMHQSKRLHIIPMTKKGKNAADFVLSFYGGVLHERLPLKIPFVVVSKDKGLSQLVEHLGLLGRAAQLISTDIVKHLTFGRIPHGTTTSTSTTTTTTTTTSTSTLTEATKESNDQTKNNKSSAQWGAGNPFAENATEYTLDQAVWFVVQGISKIEEGQRPKTRQKLDNVVGGFLKRIPGKKDKLSLQAVIEGMQTQNFVFLDGTKVVYLF